MDREKILTILRYSGNAPEYTDQILEEIKKQLWAVLEQSRKGEPIDLSEEWFELFSAIQNDGIGKEIKELKEKHKEGAG